MPYAWAYYPLIAASLIFAAMWVFFATRGVVRAMTGTVRGPAPTLLAELSLLTALYGLVRGYGAGALGGLIFPPIVFPSIPNLTEFDVIVGRFLLVAIPVVAICFMLGRKIFHGSSFLVLFSTCIAFLVGCLAVENLSQSAMCERAGAAGLTSVERNSFWWSLANTPREFQFEIHAIAYREESRFGWSYSLMDWYTIPDSAWGNVISGEPACL